MDLRVYFRVGFLVTILVGVLFSQATAISTRDRILSDVSFSRAEEYSIIKVSFNFPVRYLRHYPLNYGKEVRIQLEPILTSQGDEDALKKGNLCFHQKITRQE